MRNQDAGGQVSMRPRTGAGTSPASRGDLQATLRFFAPMPFVGTVSAQECCDGEGPDADDADDYPGDVDTSEPVAPTADPTDPDSTPEPPEAPAPDEKPAPDTPETGDTANGDTGAGDTGGSDNGGKIIAEAWGDEYGVIYFEGTVIEKVTYTTDDDNAPPDTGHNSAEDIDFSKPPSKH